MLPGNGFVKRQQSLLLGRVNWSFIISGLFREPNWVLTKDAMMPVLKPVVLPRTGVGGIRQAAEAIAELGLDCGGVTDSDQSFIQLIAACHRSAAAQGQRFPAPPSLAGALPGAQVRCGV